MNSIDDCWNQIGVWGDRSCDQLETTIHCRNCPVYATAGRNLLERDVPIEYLDEWTATIATPLDQMVKTLNLAEGDRQSVTESSNAFSVILFRLGDEQFALSVGVLHEVTHPGAIHRLPHRTNDSFLGLISIRGEILMTISLSHFLGLKTVENSSSLSRLLVVGHHDRKWVFPVDEVYRIHRVEASRLKAVPVVVSQASESYTQGIIDWQTKKVNYLDADLLFYTLERKIL